MDREIAGDWKSFDIPEVSSDEAPICMSFERKSGYDFIQAYCIDNRADIRFMDGKFYRPKVEADGTSFRADGLAGTILIDYTSFGDGLRSKQILMSEGVARLPRPTFKGETWSDESDIVEALDKMADGLLLVDGTVWESCPEPVLLVEEELGRHDYIAVSPAFLDTYRPDNKSKYYVFDIDQSEEAFNFCESRKVHTGLNIQINVATKIDVYSPELITRGHMVDDITRHAKVFVEETGRPSLNSVTPQYSRAWSEFATAQREANYSKADVDIERLLEAWIELAGIREASYLPTLGEADRSSKDDYCRNMALSMMERFENRAVIELEISRSPRI